MERLQEVHPGRQVLQSGPTVRRLDARIEELAQERKKLSIWKKALNCFWGEGEGSIAHPPLIVSPVFARGSA